MHQHGDKTLAEFLSAMLFGSGMGKLAAMTTASLHNSVQISRSSRGGKFGVNFQLLD
jgi:hypothetical protein